MRVRIQNSNIKGNLTPPGSKSMMQRALAAVALAKGETTTINPCRCDDASAATDIIQAMGVRIIIVSACLAGVKCRYDGNDNLVPEIEDLVLSGKAIALCPEELGGLTTPRTPCELIKKDKQLFVLSKNQLDCTKEFQLGADRMVKIAKILNCRKAILKANSPSCGYGIIYDGSFSGNLAKGNGLTAELLHKNGVQIRNERNYHTILNNKK